MKKEEIIMALMTIAIIVLVGILMLEETQSQFLEFCADKEWKGTHEIGGDFSGEVDCEAMWEEKFADRKWAEKCSDFPFTTKPSCKWLCIQDCMMINKKSEDSRCVC